MTEASGTRGPARPAGGTGAEGPADLETRTRLLDAAQALFATRGFDATRTKQIADRAGVSNGLLFYYFPTKQQLLEALIAERSFVPELHGFLQHACRDIEREDPRSTLVEIGRRLLHFLHEHRDLTRIMVQAPLSRDDGPFQPLRQTLQSGMDELADYINRLVHAGRLAPTDARVFARVFFSSFAFTVIAPLPEDPDGYAAATVDLLLHQSPAARPAPTAP